MGQGWVEAQYLTEQVDLETFAEDARPVRLIKDFAKRRSSLDDFTFRIGRRIIGDQKSTTVKKCALTYRTPANKSGGIGGMTKLRSGLAEIIRACDGMRQRSFPAVAGQRKTSTSSALASFK